MLVRYSFEIRIMGLCAALVALLPLGRLVSREPLAASSSPYSPPVTLYASDGRYGDGFGADIAVEGSSAIISATGRDRSGSEDVGAAYVFERRAGGWTEKARVDSPVGTGAAHFGSSVALSGDTLAVAAPYFDQGEVEQPGYAEDAGTVFIFTGSHEDWHLTAKSRRPICSRVADSAQH